MQEQVAALTNVIRDKKRELSDVKKKAITVLETKLAWKAKAVSDLGAKQSCVITEQQKVEDEIKFLLLCTPTASLSK